MRSPSSGDSCGLRLALVLALVGLEDPEAVGHSCGGGGGDIEVGAPCFGTHTQACIHCPLKGGSRKQL